MSMIKAAVNNTVIIAAWKLFDWKLWQETRCWKKQEMKIPKDIMVIKNDINKINMTSTKEANLKDTLDSFKELTKVLKITEISNLCLLINNKPKTLAINYSLINDLVSKVILSICNHDNSADNLTNSNYLNLFNLLKRAIIDTSASKSIIKKKCVPKHI